MWYMFVVPFIIFFFVFLFIAYRIFRSNKKEPEDSMENMITPVVAPSEQDETVVEEVFIPIEIVEQVNGNDKENEVQEPEKKCGRVIVWVLAIIGAIAAIAAIAYGVYRYLNPDYLDDFDFDDFEDEDFEEDYDDDLEDDIVEDVVTETEEA